jgi:hypothetical protein
MQLLLIILVVLLLCGGVPLGYTHYGYSGGIVPIIVVIILVLLLTGRL